jgi:hypothetical protein
MSRTRIAAAVAFAVLLLAAGRGGQEPGAFAGSTTTSRCSSSSTSRTRARPGGAHTLPQNQETPVTEAPPANGLRQSSPAGPGPFALMETASAVRLGQVWPREC